MSWSYKRVMMSVMVLLATVHSCESAEDEKVDGAGSGIPVSYDKNGNLYIAHGRELKKAGSEEVMYAHPQPIIDIACSPKDQNIVGMVSNSGLSEVNISTRKTSSKRDEKGIVSVQYASDGTLICIVPSTDPQRFTAKEIERVDTRTSTSSGASQAFSGKDLTQVPFGRISHKAGVMEGKKFYPIIVNQERWNLVLFPSLTLFRTGAAKEYGVTVKDYSNYNVADFCYADEQIAIFNNESESNVWKIELFRLDLESKQLHNQDEVGGLSKDKYDRIELTGGNGLVATKPGSGADFYSIMSGYGVFSDGLMKRRSISTNAPIRQIASTPPGWFHCGRTALSTDDEVQEIDSGTGEPIVTYDAEGTQISWNWWRTVRRNVVMPVLGAASVAAAVLAYSHFQGKK